MVEKHPTAPVGVTRIAYASCFAYPGAALLAQSSHPFDRSETPAALALLVCAEGLWAQLPAVITAHDGERFTLAIGIDHTDLFVLHGIGALVMLEKLAERLRKLEASAQEWCTADVYRLRHKLAGAAKVTGVAPAPDAVAHAPAPSFSIDSVLDNLRAIMGKGPRP